jgi:hypothetical protein
LAVPTNKAAVRARKPPSFESKRHAYWKLSVVSGPRNHQGRTAASRRGGGRFLAEGQDLGQCTDDGDLAMAARLTGRPLDSIDERTNGLDDLRACRLVLQRLLKFPYLFTIEFRKIGMDNDPLAVVSRHQSGIQVSLASLQAPQLVAH